MELFQSPIEAVQLIPIFSYLNILSDFLIITNYLPEIDHSKNIQVVNALYEYLQDNQNDKFQNRELISNLLKGSDLYGANDNEYVDITFANAMLDYIITSLVFEKYGNIYGFLANIFLQVENLQISEVLNRIKINLSTASFENEYGGSSKLSVLAVQRIYNDIMLPLFPRANDNINLLSHDYIYTQVGLMFLRPGKMNFAYYTNFDNYQPMPEVDVFEEYLIIGYAIEKLLPTNENTFIMLKAFALPAITYYVFNSKYLFTYANMANEISESIFWKKAYEHLFQYLNKAFNNMEFKLKNIYIPKMHMSLFSFKSTFNEENCTHLKGAEKDYELPLYVYYNKTFKCESDNLLPNLEEYASSQINITALYEIYYLQLLQDAFPKSLLENLEHINAKIKLIVPDNKKQPDATYDILELSYSNNTILHDYILKLEDSKLILRKEMKSVETATVKLLKSPNESMDAFLQNLVNYKKSRLEAYLNLLDEHQENNNIQLPNNWWKEFDLSIVSYQPCSSKTTATNTGNICTSGNIKYSDNCQQFLCTTIRSVLLKNTISEEVDKILPTKPENRSTIINALSTNQIFEDICQHINNPSFQLTFANQMEISILKDVIFTLKDKTDFNFTSVIDSLSHLATLKWNVNREIGTIDGNSNQVIFINTLYNQTKTGYGYKFIYLPESLLQIAQLRTGNEFKDVRLFSQGKREKEMKMFIALSNDTLKPDINQYMYEINYKLQRKPTKVKFFGLPIQYDDYDQNCNDNEYYQRWKNLNHCRRTRRFKENSESIKQAIEFVKKMTRFCEQNIRSVLKKFTFPDNATLTQFVKDYIKNNSFNEPTWSQKYLIDNSELLRKVRYDPRFEIHSISPFEAKLRIKSMYSSAEIRCIEKETSLKTIVNDYNNQNATYFVTFHDYYAIRNYFETGYMRIGGDTKEAKLMKIALYTLAIRQSDDPNEEFESKLFRVKSISIQSYRIISSKENITLQKFTQTYPSIAAAMRFVGYPAHGYINIVYEMVFSGPYVRAKIEQFYIMAEKNVILLPGSEFFVENRDWVQVGGLGRVYKLRIRFKHSVDEKYAWYRNIMKAIATINL